MLKVGEARSVVKLWIFSYIRYVFGVYICFEDELVYRLEGVRVYSRRGRQTSRLRAFYTIIVHLVQRAELIAVAVLMAVNLFPIV